MRNMLDCLSDFRIFFDKPWRYLRNSSATKAQRRDMNYKTLSKREESIDEKL